MHPFIFGISTQFVLIFFGVIVALILFRFLSYKYKMTDPAFKLYGIISIISIIGGFVFAILFQILYDAIAGNIEDGYFKNRLSMTFMGGLVGAAAIFITLTLIFAKGSIKKEFWTVCCIAPVCVCAAHTLGRVGCFFNGCCYGIKLKSGGVDFPFRNGANRLPTQLIEAAFLAVLCLVLLVLILKYKRFSLTPIVYLFGYSVFRFILEFWRDDDRGQFGILSPSQWQSIVMFMGAIALCFMLFYYKKIIFNGKQSNISKFLVIDNL